MTRDIRLVPTAALTASVVALVLWAVQNPHAAMWAVVVALFLAVGGLFTLAKESIDLRADLDDKDRKVEALEAELVDRDETIADLTAALAEATATLADARVVLPLRPVPLRAVPPQRDGSEYEWPRIARVLEIEEEQS